MQTPAFDWRNHLTDLENRIEVASAALEDVRLALRRMIDGAADEPAEQPSAVYDTSSWAAPAIADEAVAEYAAHVEAEAVAEYEVTPFEADAPMAEPQTEPVAAMSGWTSMLVEPQPDPAAATSDWTSMPERAGLTAEVPTEQPATAEEHQAAHGSREGSWPSSSSWQAPSETTTETPAPGDDVKEGGWPSSPDPAAFSLDSPAAGPSAATGGGWATWHEAPPVMGGGSTTGAPEADPVRDEVRRMVETTRAELTSGSNAGEPPAGEWALEEPQETQPVEDAGSASFEEIATPEDVQELPSDEAEEPGSVRDDVRRAVEQLKAELAGGLGDMADMRNDEPSAAVSAMTERYDQRERDIVAASPPTIVLEDSDGHVELVSIFDTLSRVDCADQAVLLNYAPHSVTVGIASHALPEADALAAAVEAVFGRTCEVKAEASRLTVRIASQQERVA